MKAWEEAYRTLLFIRPGSQQARCSLCVGYNLILRRLKRNVPARQAQMAISRRHLEKQYQDRIRYWQARSESKLGEKPDGTRLIAVPIDSIDHSKFAVPRSPSMSSKTFAQFIRPCLGGDHGYRSRLLCFSIRIRTAFISRFVMDIRAHCVYPAYTWKRVFSH